MSFNNDTKRYDKCRWSINYDQSSYKYVKEDNDKSKWHTNALMLILSDQDDEDLHMSTMECKNKQSMVVR